jgi:putative spermidine/putrescine transport system substrate-binding protein
MNSDAGSAALSIVSYGGTYQDAQRKAFFEPFAKEAGVRVIDEPWSGDLEELEAKVKSGEIAWDVVAVEAYMVRTGAEKDLFLPIDSEGFPKDELLPQAVHDYGVATCFWSTVLGFNTKAFPEGQAQPATWKDFWDVEIYPGPRALRRDPVGNLEIALMADGVPMDEIYPIDLDRAFESLDRIRPHVTHWWEAGQQPADWLASGEVALASVWSGRTTLARREGKPVAHVWPGGLISSDWWVIPRGAKNSGLARKFIAFASSSGPQADYPNYIPYGPVNAKALKRIDPALASDIPTGHPNIHGQIFVDRGWWYENREEAYARWNAWIAEASPEPER